MADVQILVADRNGVTWKNLNFMWLDYNFTSSTSELTGTFSITCINDVTRSIAVGPGYYIQFKVGGKVAFSGVVQKIEIRTDKKGRTIRVSGKDMSSVLVESYCYKFSDYKDWPLYLIVNDLIGQTNFLVQTQAAISFTLDPAVDNQTAMEYQAEALSKDKKEDKPISQPLASNVFYDEDFLAATAKESFKVNVGDTVYSKISELVTGAGFNCLFSSSTGQLYIGDLEKKRNNEKKKNNIVYEIYNNTPGSINTHSNNALSSLHEWDESDQYATVTVYSQLESGLNVPGTYKNKWLTTENDNKNKNRRKKFMAVSVDNEPEPQKIAWQIIEDQQIAGFKLTYELPGHIQKGEIWRVNRLVKVSDNDISEIRSLFSISADSDFLLGLHIVRCTLTYDQSSGAMTTIEISPTRRPYDPS